MGILTAIFERRGRTAVSNPRNPAYWLQSLFGGGASRAGVEVTERTAFTVSEVFACVRNISEDVAKLPLKVYRSDGRSRLELSDHPLRYLLDVEPNPEMSSLDFRQAINGTAMVYGNGYAEIERNGAGRPHHLWPLHPARVKPKRVAGQLMFEVRQSDGSTQPIPMVDMFHIRGFSLNGLLGEMMLDLAKESIGVSLAVERFAAAFFGNGAMPGGIFKHPKTMGKTARDAFRQEWNELHQGPDNAHQFAILEEGMEYTAASIPPEAAQFIETRQFDVEVLARWFRMPPHKIGHLLRSTNNNIEQQGREYVDDTLMAWLVRFEKEGDRKLFSVGESGAYLKHNVKALLRGDSAARSEFYNKMTTIGAMTINEVRAAEDMNPVEGGDRHFVQLNMVALDKVDEAKPAPKPPAKPTPAPEPAPEPEPEPEPEANSLKLAQLAEHYAKLFADCYRRILRVEVDRVRRESKKGTALTFEAWRKEFYAEHVLYVRGGIGAAVEACAGSAWVILRDDAMPAAVAAQIAAAAQSLSDKHVTKSQAGLAATSRSVEVSLASWAENRADVDGAAAANHVIELITNLAKEKAA